MKTIVLTFSNGKVEIETSGYAGGSCMQDPLVKELKQDLGEAERTQLKPEARQTNAAKPVNKASL